MKYVDEFRDPQSVRKLLAAIRSEATRPHVLMEVCGGQTHGLLRYGIDRELRGVVELIHGPGCPVCVTPAEDIDFAVELAQRGITVASFGDMLRVPGTTQSLNDARALGGRVQLVYSPLDAVSLAQRSPDLQVVFFAVGFETTAPATALAALQARRLGLQNFSLLVSHVRVLPVMEALMRAPGNRVQGFLAAGHVCTITGFEAYRQFVARFGVPVAVTGFEPIDLLEGIRDCVRQLESGTAEVTNQYARSVRPAGNLHARDVIRQVYQVADCPWRGLGVIETGGYRLQPEFQALDARSRFREVAAKRATVETLGSPQRGGRRILPDSTETSGEDCPSADVLSGRIRPHECPHFGTTCTPDRPLGAPMVSSEGACAAYFRYRATEGCQRAGRQAHDQSDAIGEKNERRPPTHVVTLDVRHG